MKTYKIRKGCHYSNWFSKPMLMAGSNFFEQSGDVMFTESCKYYIDEKLCVNKLFGFCLGVFGVHKNSVRFGWTYNSETDNIDLWKYVYSNGQLDQKVICSCKINETHNYSIDGWIHKDNNGELIYETHLRFDGNRVDTVTIKSSKWFAWTLGPYFGGNTRAPHDINILEC